ncbi:MAG: hypothetical protein GF320_07885 [Armatimonadia bacterium]|nr:hypothetical protein [Armatimonadia bacterium]
MIVPTAFIVTSLTVGSGHSAPPQGTPPPPGAPPPNSGPDPHNQHSAPYPQHGYGYQKPQAPNAILILILTIVGWAGVWPAGWVAFFLARKEMAEHPYCQMTRTCYWLSLVHVILSLVGLAFVAIYMIFWFAMFGLVVGGAAGASGGLPFIFIG